jgi:hypothetical protein
MIAVDVRFEELVHRNGVTPAVSQQKVLA